MSWTADEQRGVTRALLGSWPGTISTWGREAFAAYIGELEARGLTAEGVLIAIRTWPAGSDFPPSAPNLASAARKDPSQPTFEEAWVQIREVLKARTTVRKSWWEAGERERLNEQAILERSQQPDVHPLVASFVARQGVGHLRGLGLDDPGNEFAGARRHELREAWEQHVEAMDGREVASLVSGRRGELGAFDPLAALGVVRREIGAGI